jgi:cob(I)alamin adenosyltransferase
MRIYTKTGDGGETGLCGGVRVPKDHPRIKACGEVDELNAAIGVARSQGPDAAIDAVLERVQRDLFSLGADLATEGPGGSGGPRIAAPHVARLEADIDLCDGRLPALRQFILPGGSPLAARLHLARAVCRRAERAVVTLSRSVGVSQDAVHYLNRLSDLLFVLARTANAKAGVADVVWES